MQRHDPTPTLNHLFFQHLDEFRRERLLTWRSSQQMVVYSSDSFARTVFALQNFLSSCGLAAGDRVAIFAENRPEWHIADFAILLARRIVVPIYATLALGQIQYLLEHSGCRAVIVSGQRQWEGLASMLPNLPSIDWVVSMDDCKAATFGETGHVTCLKDIVSEAPPLDQAAVASIRSAALSADPHSVATIVYTSGTTATPKGVMLSHANIMFDLSRCVDRLCFRTVKQALSVLPLPHVFERLLCYGYFRMGVPIAYGDPHELRDLVKLHRPQVMGCVPRVLEKVREAVHAQIERMPGWKQTAARRLFATALGTAAAAAERRRASLRGRLSRALLALRIRRQLGGLKYFICGGAWLDPGLELFFRSVGFTVLQGYGMTETSPVITLTPLGREKLASVGPALDGVELRISEDGEVMTRGPHVMLGYFNDSEAAAGVFRDGWLMTGDLGVLDEQGFLRITGRRKETLVLSNGKKLCCPIIERALERSSVIQNAFLAGEGRKFASALIVPHVGNLARLARESGIQFENASELLHCAAAWALMSKEIEAHQAAFSNFERIRRFCFLPEQALLDPELMTPTQKMRRDVLERRYRASIEQMYAQEDPFVISQTGAPQTHGAAV